jgi:hypothetical protein
MSVTEKDTGMPTRGAPEKLLTVADNVEVTPPTISEVLPELAKVILAPTTVT